MQASSPHSRPLLSHASLFVCIRQKAEAMRKLADQYGLNLTASFAYGDSIHDHPMLALVGHPVCINPESELNELAHDRDWKVVHF